MNGWYSASQEIVFEVVSYFLCVSLRLGGKQVVRAHLPQEAQRERRDTAEKKFQLRPNSFRRAHPDR